MKKLISFLLPLLVFLLFHRPIEILIDSTIVEYVLKYVGSEWYNDLAIFVLSGCSLYAAIRKWKKYTPSNTLTFLLIQFTILYSFYRFGHSPWSLVDFEIVPQLKYMDATYILLISNLILHRSKKSQLPISNSLLLDQSLGDKGEDFLGYTNYAKSISKRIKEEVPDNAFAIGINGKWGLGKTSFIDLIKRNLKEESHIIQIDFNAWNSSSPESIIIDFFNTLEEALSPYHQSLPRLFRKYSQRLLELNEGNITKGVSLISTLFSRQQSINSIHKEINLFLERTKRKLIIYIDDLDRLDKNEIIEIIRLIRNTANFHNAFFIVAYDRNYVVNALRDQNPYRSEEFLEKIFQIEVTLPFFRKEILVTKLADELKERLPEKFGKEVDESTIGGVGIEIPYLKEWLESLRDVNRLVNSIVMNIENLKGEVAIHDMIRIELLRLKFPSVYELLYRKTKDFLESAPINDGTTRHHYKLKNLENRPYPEKGGLKVYYLIHDHIFENDKDLSVAKSDIGKLIDFLSSIFPDRYEHWSGTHNLSIVYPSKFYRYFNYSLLAGNLSEVEFDEARSSGNEEFKRKIEEWVKRELEFEVQLRLMEISSYDDVEDFKTIISGIFHLAKQPTKKPSTYYSKRIVGYDAKDLINKISNYDDRLTSSFFLGDNGLYDYREFIRSFFREAEPPFEFESAFIKTAIDDHFARNFGGSGSFPLAKEELVGINTRYFQKYCEANQIIDDHTWNLYQNSQELDYVPQGGNSYSKETRLNEDAILVFKEFVVKKDFDGFLSQMIKSNHPFNSTQLKYGVSDFIVTIFGGWEEFETVLFSADKTSVINEFIDFYKKLLDTKEKHKTDYVEFEFKEIKFR